MSLNNIPKLIHQTWKRKNNLPEPVKNSIEKWKNLNLEYKHIFYDDTDCINFINENFEEKVGKSFLRLIPGAFKADLFRYCVLYIKGGVYADIDTEPLEPLKKIIVDCDFLSVKEKNNIPGIYQAFIVCKPNLTFFRKAIDKIVLNVENKFYPKLNRYKNPWIGVLSITGPVLLKNILDEYLQNNNLDFKLLEFDKNHKNILNLEKIKVINICIEGYNQIFESYFKKVKLKKIYLKDNNE